jgi:hypothetical protein
VVPAEKTSRARTLTRSRPGRAPHWLGCLLAATWLGTAAAAAQPRTPDAEGQPRTPGAERQASAAIGGDERRILLLRAEETPPRGAAANVERSLRQALQELGFVVTVSSIPFRDAQLASGCPGTIRECGPSMAGAIEGGRLAVSAIGAEADEGELSLRLYSFTASGEAREASGELPSAPPAQLHGAVRQLARAVYGQPAHDQPSATARSTQTRRGDARDAAPSSAPAALASARASRTPRLERQRATHRDPVLWATGWSATGLGSALLVGGMASHLAAGGDHDRYPSWSGDGGRSTPAAALASYERAERQADAARVLYGAGGALLLTGAALLVVGRLSAQRRDSGGLQASLLPLRHGAALSFAGSFGGESP